MLETTISDGVSIFRLRAPRKNALTFELLEAILAALGRASDDETVHGIVLTGDSAHFSVGADITLFDQVVTSDDAVHVSRVFQDAFQQIEDSPKPVVAALAGTIIGGALELAMACHYRVAATGSRFRMPEVKLDINPGAGGTQRLPRLIGVDAALRMLLTAETVGVERAVDLGLIDAVCRGDQLVSAACAMLQDRATPRRTGELTEKIAQQPERDAAFQRAWQVVEKTRPELIGPRTLVTAVQAGVTESIASGMAAERHGFAECMGAGAARNKIHLFFATRRASKVPELADERPRPVARVGVVGMGTMGTGIAQAFALAGVPVVVRDQDDAALRRGSEKIRDSIQKQVARGKLSAGRADQLSSLITTTTRGEDLATVDLVVESVFEDVAVKRTVIRALEEGCRDDAILATNTSTISLDELAAGMRHPERLVGMHFFNPAQRMPLVEIIRRKSTPRAIVATMLELAKRLRKTPVVVANRPGFLVNRLFIPYLQEAFYLLEEGATPADIDAAAVEFGFPMGPLVLIDMAGLDILVSGQRVLHSAFPRHGPLSPIATRLVEHGHLGQKTGMGVYQYDPGDTTPRASRETALLITAVQREGGVSPREFLADEITERLMLRMASEGLHVIDEGIFRNESDLDVAMVLGTGFPDFRGGILKYIDDIGGDAVRTRLDELGQQCGARYLPPRDLR